MPIADQSVEPPHDLAPAQERIRMQLERMLASQHFCHSKRYPVLLRFVVERTLRGEADTLKERTVGVEAFQRKPTYDTNLDPIVRITAGEVRKRIAQYYHDEGHGDELRIDLPAGSYIPSFSQHNKASTMETQVAPAVQMEDAALCSAAEDSPGPALNSGVFAPRASEGLSPRKPLRWLAVAGVCLATVGAIGWLVHARAQDTWEPWLASATQVVVAVGEPGLVMNTDATSTPNPVTVAEHLRHVHSLTYSDTLAFTRVSAVLDRGNRSYRLLTASGTTFGDMRQGPSILIGGYDNPWTLRVLQTSRYQFRRTKEGISWIEDAREPGSRRWVLDFSQPYSELTQDYAIVARLLDPGTHQPVMVIAGIGEDGTKAASEFATEPEGLNAALGKDKSRNVEIVLGAQVINGISGPPKILAREVW